MFFISFVLVLSSNLQFCYLFVLASAWDVLGGLADLEQLLGKLLPTGSLPEERSKATDVRSRNIQVPTVRLPQGTVRPPVTVWRWSDRLPLEQRPYALFQVHTGRVRVMAMKLSASTVAMPLLRGSVAVFVCDTRCISFLIISSAHPLPLNRWSASLPVSDFFSQFFILLKIIFQKWFYKNLFVILALFDQLIILMRTGSRQCN
jgi:hypothetical protein